MKKKFRILLVSAVFLLMSISASFAEMPGGTVILNGKAYSFEYFNSNVQAIMEVGQAISNNDSVYVKVGQGATSMFMDVVKNTMGSAADIPEVEYYDPDGNTTTYAANDGDEVSSNTPTVKANFTTGTSVGNFEFGTVGIELSNIEGASTYAVEYLVVAGSEVATQTTAPVAVSVETETIAKPDTVKVMVYDSSSSLIATFENVPLDGTPVKWTDGEVENFSVVDIY
ncbi:hypothetical protein SAMN02745945_01899 [Peptoclostridium litorale DSM 5388]|uniref:Uncharacterized protein n=1 Tax=Peptoclostridium litorale DSM 5388 TaxID=1121324 RepID=A0A069RGL8_PEPLI|nr:hypothetical protein [Peptoclostridium litorale]KDR96169.1 hypothetical protein CLIT_4c00060 [Peptoclostridium litorale DSM 5388]SIO12850.1 hypothetical protein SAMN02745945_01899 [Peptoclostridium litorale DSM 5388]